MGLAFGAYQLTAKGYRQYQLQKQIEEKNSELEKMRSTMTKLESTLEILTQENQSLQQSIESQEEGEEEKGGADLSLPRLYPSDGVGDLKSTFTTETPYITIGMRKGDNVVATGDGVVSRVDYDANYLNSVETISPFTLPEIIMFCALMFPVTFPSGPRIRFPLIVQFPFMVPSILMVSCTIISPLKTAPVL